MKRLLVLLLFLYCGACYAINERDIPHVFVDPQGNAANYANLYRVEGDQVIIRYYFDASIDRLAVEDGQASYALNSIIRDEWREGLLRWVNASGHRLSIEEVTTASRANVVVYGLRNWPYPTDTHVPTVLSFPMGMGSPREFPRASNTGAVYVIGNGIQRYLSTFLDRNTVYSQRFRTYTGLNHASQYLSYMLFMDLNHEAGHILGLAHPDSSSSVAPGGYTQRPIAHHMPSAILPGTQVMTQDPLDYLAGRFSELGNHWVDRNAIEASSQERWLMLFLWHQRHRLLHCLPPSSSARNLNQAASATSSTGCLGLVGPTSPPWLLLVGS